jgi:hypothetical protein
VPPIMTIFMGLPFPFRWLGLETPEGSGFK